MMETKYVMGKFRVEIIFVLFLCGISFCFTAVTDAATESEKDFCSKPVPSDNPVDVKWLHEHFEDGWNIQFGHREERKQLSQFIKGFRNTDEEDDYSQMCARVKLDYVDEHFTGLFTGYGGKVSPFNCTRTFACNIVSSDMLAAVPLQIHISYFDGKGKDDHNMFTIIQCPSIGEPLWTVVTRTKTISEEETKIITEHLKSIGFDPDNRVPFQSPSC